MLDKIIQLRNEAKKEGNPVLRDKSFEKLLEEIKKKSPARILEIGTNVGLTGVAMLLVSPTSQLTGIEIDEETAKKARNNYKLFNVDKRAKIFCGSASEILPVLTGEYDFVFLDGPKGHYAEYMQSISKILKTGGTLFADNVLYRGYLSGKVKVPHSHATILHSLENFMQEITDKEKYDTEVFDIEDGISISVKKR